MQSAQTASRPAAGFSIAAAVILVGLGAALVGRRDPDLMSIAVVILTTVTGIAYAATNRDGRLYRAAVAVALAATFVLFWGIGAVGFMGNDYEHPNDLMYIVVPIVGIVGAVLARFQPRGMARAMFATALAQMLVPATVVVAGLNLVPISVPELIFFTLVLNGPFIALYIASGWLFLKAASGARAILAR